MVVRLRHYRCSSDCFIGLPSYIGSELIESYADYLYELIVDILRLLNSGVNDGSNGSIILCTATRFKLSGDLNFDFYIPYFNSGLN